MRYQNLRNEFKTKLESRCYATGTIDTWMHSIKLFLRAHKSKDMAKISEREIEKYIIELRLANRISKSYKRQMASALKKFYLLMFEKDIELDIANITPSSAAPLPQYLQNSEIKGMIRRTSNVKHQCIIGILYSTGLTVKELINLKNSDFDFAKSSIRVSNPRTGKQRTLPLSSYLVPFLKAYRKCYKNDEYTIQGYKNESISSRAIQRVVKEVAHKTGIKGEIKPTMLRNSFAIHLLQAGSKPELVQELLGLETDQSMKRFIMEANKQGPKLKSPMD